MSASSNSNVVSVFDLDDTLLHSRPAVYRAYLEAGVEMPEYAWGLPAREWLIDACGGDEDKAWFAHDVKNEAYPEMLKLYGRRLPLALYASALVTAEMPVHVVTGASLQAAHAALEFLELDRSLLLDVELTREGKESLLGYLRVSSYRIGVYFDDDGEEIKMPDDWVRVRVM